MDEVSQHHHAVGSVMYDVASQPHVRTAVFARPRWSVRLPISERRVVLALGDIGLCALSVFLALGIWAFVERHTFTTDFIVRHSYWFAVLPLLWYILAAANDYYNLRVAARIRSSLFRLCQINLQLLVAYVAIFFVSPREALPRLFIIYYAVLSLLFVGLWRACRLFLVGWTGFRRRALVIGAGTPAELICHAIEEEAHGDYEVVGCVVSEDDDTLAFAGASVLGKAAHLPRLVADLGVSELIVTYINAVPSDVFDALMALYTHGVAITPMPLLYEEVTGRVPIEHVGEHLWSLVLPLAGESLTFNLYQMAKRASDIVLSLVGLTVFCVVLLPVLALVIKLDSRGPVFYRQERLGRAGAAFRIYKLRSMCDGAEDDSGPLWAAVNDPRVTRVGSILRKTRLDEIPQLFNVLRGEMTMVGPRPERRVFVDLLEQKIPFYRSRLVVKPGVTGWAQIRHPYGNTEQDALRKLQFDLHYIRHQSLMRDLMIMMRTAGTMLTFRGM